MNKTLSTIIYLYLKVNLIIQKLHYFDVMLTTKVVKLVLLFIA